MAINLQKGQRVSLDNSMKFALVGLGWDTNRYEGSYDFDLDASAFMLGANGKLLRDEDFVFYNNLNGRDGAVVCTSMRLLRTCTLISFRLHTAKIVAYPQKFL